MAVAPLNGVKTHPLSEHAFGVLRRLADSGPIATYRLNPGVINRLQREDLITVTVPIRARERATAFITDAGRAVLASQG